MLDIYGYLESHGYTLRKQGKTHASSRCPKCGDGTERGNKVCAFVGKDGRQRWFCHACGVRGDLADLICAIEGVSLREALGRTSPNSRQGPPTATPSPAQPAKPYGASLDDPDLSREDLGFIREVVGDLRNGLPMWEAEPGAYLLKRGISKAVAVEACHRGILRMLPSNPQHARDLLIRSARGADRMAKAGLWAGSSSTWPANAFRPLVFFADTTMEFRLIQKDSKYPKSIRLGRLTKPYVWRGDPARVIVVEGVIDLLSLVEMGEKRTIMALPGVNAWRPTWFTAAHKAYGSSFAIALDDDNAGNMAAQSMLKMLGEQGIEATRLLPAEGKDWNEMLCTPGVTA